MRDNFPFIDVLTIPVDAGPGDPRIVIDGINGEILIYDNNGNLYGSITPDEGFKVQEIPGGFDTFVRMIGTTNLAAVQWSTGDVNEDDLGQAYPTIISWSVPFNTTQLALRIQSPSYDSATNEKVVLELTGLSADENIAGDFTISGGDGGAGQQSSIPRGVLQSTGNIDTATSGFTVSSDVSDMVFNNVPQLKQRYYYWHCWGTCDINGVGAIWSIWLYKNGSPYARIFQARTDGVGDPRFQRFDIWTLYVAPSNNNTDDWKIRVVEELGAATFTILGTASDTFRGLSLHDMGLVFGI